MRTQRTIPAAFFGMVLGLVGLGGNWRGAARLWGLPVVVGEAIMALALLVWLVLAVAYAYKWIAHRQAALDEVRHPVQCCFIGLVPSSLALLGVTLAPYSRALAVAALLVGGAGHVAFSVWRVGGMWRGDRDVTTTTAVLYLPSVAGNFIVGTVAGALGYPSWGILFFGAGAFSWLALESVILFRLFNAPALAVPLRPTLGIQLAPPVVATATWLANTTGVPDLMVQAMWGYGLLQLLLLVRALPWIAQQPFAPSYWAFSFGLTALSGDAIQMTLRQGGPAVATLAPVLFGITNLGMLVLLAGTVVRMAQDKLLPPATAPAPVPADPPLPA